MSKILLLAFLPVIPIAVAYADHDHHQPPQAAFDACASAKVGAACSVTFGDHTMTGTCEASPDSAALACRPDHPPGPPPEAIAACSSAKAGDACSFAHGDHTIAGNCEAGHEGTTLACHPPHHDHHN